MKQEIFGIISRFFSLYNQVKTVQKFSLKPKTTENLVRIAHASGVTDENFNAIKYARGFSRKYARVDDLQYKPAYDPAISTEDQWFTSPYEDTPVDDNDLWDL